MVGYSEAAFGRWSHVRRACSNVSLSASAGQCHFSPDGEAIARGDRRISGRTEPLTTGMIWRRRSLRMSFAEQPSFWRAENWQEIKGLRRDVFRTCTFSVRFQWKTRPKLRQLPPYKRHHSRGLPGRGAAPVAYSLGRAAGADVGEYGELAARDATVGRTVAKKRRFGPWPPEHFCSVWV